MRNRAIAPMGAYLRIMASKLIFCAAFRYFSDSERSDVDRWDISGADVSMVALIKNSSSPTIERISSPQQFLHVLRHDSRYILKVVIQSVKR